MDRATTNGGFPLPPDEESVRVLTSHHDACDGHTRVRLPRAVPPRAVRRVVCDRCAAAYEPAQVAELPTATPRRRSSSARLASLPAWRPSRPQLSRPSLPDWRPALPDLSRPWAAPALSWRWASLPIAAVAVLGGLYLLQGGDDSSPAPESSTPAAARGAASGKGEPSAKAPAGAQLIRGSTFQLALPPGWRQTEPTGGATFAAVSADGDADAMLWIERDPKLNFASFEARSLDQLESLAGTAGVVARNPGPTPEETSIRIAPTSAPSGAPNYEVLLRASGNYWYYLATTSQPGASADTTQAVRVIQGSFLPQGAKR